MRGISRALALAALFIAPAAQAQFQQNINFERLQLDPGARGSLVVGTGEVGPRKSFRLYAAGHYERLPMSIDGDSVFGRMDQGQRIVEDRITIETGISYVVAPNIELYARLPVIADQKSDFAEIESSGIGTPSFGARFGLLQQRTGALANVALAAELMPSWGKQEILAKEDSLALNFRAEAGRTFGKILFGGQIGILDRADVLLGNNKLGSEVQGGLVTALATGAIRPELSYRFAQPLGGGAASSELLAGLRGYLGPVDAFVIAGPGFGNAPGTPQWRGLAGLAYRFDPQPKAAPAAAAAPVVVPPPVDPCAPGQTHTPEQCPNLDDDQDGVLNRDDACPTVKGIAENRGCPAKDSDGDGVPDHIDNCPDKAGPADNGGCPRAEIKAQKIEITDKVMFDTGKATLKPESDKVLTAVAEVMKAHPEVKKVSIEGHTDNTGSAATNKRLSQKRAEAVRNALVKMGVEKDRLEAKGFGPSRPVAPNDTPEGRDANRRVEFVITGMEQPAQ